MCLVQNIFGAIVCDPPYGVRAGGTKLEAKPRTNHLDPVDHIPSTTPYSLSECLWDLLDTAARLLIPGARLVYFLPSIPHLYQVHMTFEHFVGKPWIALNRSSFTPISMGHSHQKQKVSSPSQLLLSAPQEAACKSVPPKQQNCLQGNWPSRWLMNPNLCSMANTLSAHHALITVSSQRAFPRGHSESICGMYLVSSDRAL